MRKKITILLFLLSLPVMLYAGTTGKIKGKVTDNKTGEPLVGVNVLVIGTNFGAATDVNGVYTIDFLNPGVYEVRASYLGYQTVTTSNVRVNADLTTEIDFQLPPSGIQVEEVTIVAQRPLVNKSNTNAIRVTTNEDIEALPIRGINNIAALTPGVIQQNGVLYVRGGRQDETGYYVEGANITNPVSSLALGPRNSGSMVNVPQDAVEEISVQAGGYTAEFGGANAGIIRSELKSGGPQFKASLQYITDNWTFKSKSDRYNGAQNLGTYSYGYNDITATLSGPLFSNNIKFFGLFENTAQADRAPQYAPGFNLGTFADPTNGDTVNLALPGGAFPGNRSDLYSGAATFTFDFNPTIIRTYGTYTTEKHNVGASTFTMFDLNRLPLSKNYNGVLGIKLNHILSDKAYIELNASYTFNGGKTYDPILGENFLTYGDGSVNAAAGVPWIYPASQTNRGNYDVPSSYTFYSTWGFAPPNAPLINSSATGVTTFRKFENDNLDLSAALADNVNEQNALKIGGEIQIMTIRNYQTRNVNYAQLIANNPDKSVQAMLIQQGINNYGYDVFGGSYSGSSDYSTGSIAPHKPIFAGAYVEDRLEYQNLLVNAGLRFDYIKTDQQTFVDPSRPDEVFDPVTLDIIHPENLKTTSAFTSISPRLGFSFPITDRTIFHAQYGKFVQQPSLNDLYIGPYQLAYLINPNAGLFNPAPWGLDLRPTRTTQYEIGFTQQISNTASFDITAYYKDISDQVVFGQQSVLASTGWRPYQILVNGDYATTQGIEIDFNMRRTERFLVNGSISFQNAKGTGDSPFANAGEFGAAIQNQIFTPKYIVPLAFNHAINGSLNIDYRFGKDDGPSILQQFGASVLITFSSGHPYTMGTIKSPGTSNPATGVDTRNRYAIEAQNASVTPSNFNVDLRLDKTVVLMDRLSANIFIQVQNLFNSKTAVDVYSATGSAATDGFLTDPNLTGYTNVQKYGQQYADAYQSLNLDYSGLWTTPRQIRLGIRLDY
jgi:hypothetical protein